MNQACGAGNCELRRQDDFALQVEVAYSFRNAPAFRVKSRYEFIPYIWKHEIWRLPCVCGILAGASQGPAGGLPIRRRLAICPT
jgi:hypothetical protein